MDYLYILIGLAGLFLGGEALVRGSVAIANKLSIPPFVIGLTVVGFGTSTPELLVSVQAALAGVPDIAVGNVVGSNIANILLIAGVTAVIWPVVVPKGAVGRDAAFMTAAGVVLIPLFATGVIGRVAGVALLAGLTGYLLWTFLSQRPEADLPRESGEPRPILISLLTVAAGLVALVVGARLLIDGSVAIAQGFGVSEAFIGLTIVAVGTSLPELSTALVAARRRQSEIAIGNILGSNIFNVLGILGATAVISPIPIAPRFLTFDLPVMLAASLALAALLLMRRRVGRASGAVLLLGYVVYVLAAQ